MRHGVAGSKFGRTTSHKIALLRSLVTSLIEHDRIETTLPKAKELRRWADKMITLAKKNTVHSRRQAMKVLRNRSALTKLFSTLVDRYKDRAGGYTRILKLGHRHGDCAPMAVIEYLTAEAKKVFKPGEKVEHKAVKHASKSKEHAGAKKVAVKRPTKKSIPHGAPDKKKIHSKKTAKKSEK